jgi:hypothetical protein
MSVNASRGTPGIGLGACHDVSMHYQFSEASFRSKRRALGPTIHTGKKHDMNSPMQHKFD